MKSIVYVRTPESVLPEEEAICCAKQLEKDLEITITMKDTIEDLFPLLSNPAFNPNAIVIAIEDFYHIKNVDVFDIVNTLSTLIKCTVYRENNKTRRRSTEIIAIVGENSDPKLIKGIIGMSDVHLGLRLGGSIVYDDIKNDIIKYLFNKDYSVPKKITEFLKPKTKKGFGTPSIEEISLTPRQQQILSLILSRGASNKVIARILNLSESTIKLHMSAIFKKYGVKNRTQLAVFANNQNNH